MGSNLVVVDSLVLGLTWLRTALPGKRRLETVGMHP